MRSLKKRITSKLCAFCLIKKRSFNLLCVLGLFSERWQSTLFQIFFFFFFITVTCFDAMNKEALKLNTTASSFSSLIKASATTTLQNLATVSYTHLTLPTS